MTALDLSPAPGAAPFAARVLRQARTEALLLVRNGEQLLLALVIPVAILVGARFLGDRMGLSFQAIGASMVGLAIWSSAFTSVAISTGFERRYGVLERLAATPLTRTGLILGKAGAICVVVAGQIVVLVGVAVALGFRPAGTGAGAVVAAVVGCVLAVVCCNAWALALAGTVRAEVTLGVANLIHLVGLAAGLVVPVASFPAAVRPVVTALPTGALGELGRAGFGSVAGVPVWPALGVLALWTIVGLVVARKGFRWMA